MAYLVFDGIYMSTRCFLLIKGDDPLQDLVSLLRRKDKQREGVSRLLSLALKQAACRIARLKRVTETRLGNR